MSKATEPHTTPAPDENDRWSLGDIEPVLLDLKTDIAILGHLANSNDDIDPETWTLVAGRLSEAQASLATLWRKAWDQRIADREAAAAALAAAKAAKAAPGSQEDLGALNALRGVLRSCATVILEQTAPPPVAAEPDADA